MQSLNVSLKKRKHVDIHEDGMTSGNCEAVAGGSFEMGKGNWFKVKSVKLKV
jgi:hypothetical protein